jgi:uncharacterized protein (TIGR00251 family)
VKSRRDGDRDPAARLLLKVVPASSRDCISGWLGDSLKVRVRAAAERGKANASVERIVAEALGVPVECARIVAGRTSPRKTIEISGLSEADIHRRLAKSPS